MKIWVSKFVGREQVPGDEAAFERIKRAFASQEKPNPPAPKKNVALRYNRARQVTPRTAKGT